MILAPRDWLGPQPHLSRLGPGETSAGARGWRHRVTEALWFAKRCYFDSRNHRNIILHFNDLRIYLQNMNTLFFDDLCDLLALAPANNRGQGCRMDNANLGTGPSLDTCPRPQPENRPRSIPACTHQNSNVFSAIYGALYKRHFGCVSRGNLAHFPRTLVYRKSAWSNFFEILHYNSPMGLY